MFKGFPSTPRFRNGGGGATERQSNTNLGTELDEESNLGTTRKSDAFAAALGDMESVASLDGGKSDLDAEEDTQDGNTGAFDFLRKGLSFEPKQEKEEKKVRIIKDPNPNSESSGGSKRRLFKVPESQILADTFCFRTIGEGATFCTAVNCKTQHKGSRLDLVCGCAFIKGAAKNSAFVDPYVNLSHVEDTLADDWLVSAKSKEEWKDLFTKVRTLARENIGFKVSSSDIEYEAEVSDFVKEVKTPFRKNATQVKDEKVPRLGDLNKDLMSSGILGPDAEVKPDTATNVAEVLELVDALDKKLKILGASFVNVHQLVSEDHIALNQLGIKAEHELERLDNEVGVKPPNLHSSVDAPSLWSTIGLLSNLAVSAHDSSLDFSSAIKGVTEQGRDYTKEEIRKFRYSDFQPVANSVNGLQSDIQNINGSITGMEAFAQTAGRRIKELRRDVQTLTNSNRVSSASATQTTQSVTPGNHFTQGWDVNGFEDRLQKLGEDVVSLKKQGDSRVIKFRSLGFINNKDSTSFLRTEQALDDFGYVVDFHMVMEHIYQAIQAEDMLSQMDKSNKLSLDDLNQTYSMLSFQTSMPKILGKTAGLSVVKNDQSHFATIKSFADWDLIHDGYRALLKEALSNFADAHDDAIDRRLDPTSDYYNVAKLSLAESVLFVDGLINYIDEVYREYVQARFGPKKAWHIATRLAKALILQVAKPRDGVYKLFKNKNLSQISAEMFYATLRSLDEMAEIRRFNFKNTPVVSSELVKFLATNTDFESVKKLVEDHSDMSTKFKKLHDDHVAMAKTLSTYHNKVTELTNDYKQTKNELNNLQKKLKAKNVI